MRAASGRGAVLFDEDGSPEVLRLAAEADGERRPWVAWVTRSLTDGDPLVSPLGRVDEPSGRLLEPLRNAHREGHVR